MSATVTPQFGAADPNANPISVQDFVTLLNSLFLTVNVDGGPFAPYVISSTTPAVGDQDKLWAKVDGNGRPLEIRIYYNGTWRRFYTGKNSETAMFTGNPSTFFDGTGLGLPGLDWDGWALANGQNGTTDKSNLFLIGAAMNNTGITGWSGSQWQTNVTGAAANTGGASQYAIKNTDLPNMTVTVTGRAYQPSGNTGIFRTIVTADWAGPDRVDSTNIASFGSNPNGSPSVPQTSIPTLPPFYTLAYVDWVGYA